MKTVVSMSSITIAGNLADSETFLLSAAQMNESTLSCSFLSFIIKASRLRSASGTKLCLTLITFALVLPVSLLFCFVQRWNDGADE